MHSYENETERLHNALEASGIGTWSVDPSTKEINADAVSRNLFNLTALKNISYSEILAQVHPEDKHQLESVIRRILTDAESTINIKYRIFSHTGSINWLQIKGKKCEGEKLFGTVQDVTNDIEQNSYTSQSEERLRSIIEEAPIAISLYVSRKLIIGIANDIMLGYWGKDRSIIGKPLEAAVPELEGQPFLKILDEVFTTGKTYQVIEEPAKLALNGVLDVYYFDFTYKPLYNSSGKIYAIMNMAVNVTDRVIARKKQLENQARFSAIIEQSPMAIGLLKGKDFIVEIGNDKIFEVWGKDKSVIGLPIHEALPEIQGQGFITLLKNVYTTGKTYTGYNVLAKLEHNGVLKDSYFDFSYSALLDENGEVSGVLIIAADVSERISTLKKIEASEAKFRLLIESVPAALAVFKGPDFIVDIANQAFLEVVDRNESIIGRPLLEVMPEIKGQESIDLMNEVFATGKKIHSNARQVKIMKKGVLTNNYYNVSYTPLKDSNGKVYAILDTAIDVTESIKAKQAVEEAEASLRGAIELADLATWSLNPKTLEVTYSERLKDWFGLSGEIENINDVVKVIHEHDREKIAKAISDTMKPGSDGNYDEEYTVINRQTGRERILHAYGKAFFDDKGEAYLMMGTAQDITNQKKLQTALENEVKERTIELQRINNELEEANRQLINSNEELAQYAYVASHDLQEPLRKISIFSNLLKERDNEGIHTGIIDKIVTSSNRMSLLIKDLLEFSRLLNPDVRFISTDINTIVNAVKNDFEILIEEKRAEVNVGNMPVIEAVPLQMNQLFYNIISNALKFIPEGRKPVISINARKAKEQELAEYFKAPFTDTQYYIFTISDNGIGIEEKYARQIFEVFKRLHAKNEYSGSGIGLAICKRIVNTHNGHIYVESDYGNGTTFYIILPARQQH